MWFTPGNLVRGRTKGKGLSYVGEEH
jgi:hypothetical protein